MNNDKLKKKIVEVLFPVIKSGNISCNEENACKKCWWFPCEIERTAGRLADALITAGIGDVSKWKHRAEAAEDELARHKRALRIAGDKFINEVCNMRGEDVSDKCDYKCDTCFYDYYLQQAEKELAEERKKL